MAKAAKKRVLNTIIPLSRFTTARRLPTLGPDIPACLLYPDDANIVFKVKHVSSMLVNEAWLLHAR